MAADEFRSRAGRAVVPHRRLPAAVRPDDVVRRPRPAAGRAVSDEDGRARHVVVEEWPRDGRRNRRAARSNAKWSSTRPAPTPYHIARSVGLELPIVPVRHEYFVTVHADGPGADAAGRFAFPIRRSTCGPKSIRSSAAAGSRRACRPTRDEFTLSGRAAADRSRLGRARLVRRAARAEIPQVEQLGIRSVFKGWPTFTPDGRFIIGESSRVKGFVMAGGCNAHGVSGSAGIGRHVVESILEPNPSPYVKSLSPDRFDARTVGLGNGPPAGAACLRDVLLPRALGPSRHRTCDA